MTTEFTADNVAEVMREVWREMLGTEPGDIMALIAERLVTEFDPSVEIELLRGVIAFNREQNARELAALNDHRVADAAALVRIIDGTATESDQVRLRWIRAITLPDPEEDGHG